MQTDTWLTDTSYPDYCPLCSQLLVGGSNTCSSCGFTAHEPAGNPASLARSSVARPSNPHTPIPARASAQRVRSRPGLEPRRPVSHGTRLSAPKGGSWKHESPSYEAASSLTSLSLLISETPTAPPRSSRSTGRLEHIDEIDTVPQPSGRARAVQRAPEQIQAVSPALLEVPSPQHFDDLAVSGLAVILSETTPPAPFSHIDEIDTLPETSAPSSSAPISPYPATREVAVDGASWTAGLASTSSLAARLIAAHSPRHRRRRRSFNPFDRTRWWLLRAGHIEFLLWTAGSLLLFGITFLILLATVLSVMVPGLVASGNFPTSTVNASVVRPVGTLALANGLHLTLSGPSSLAPGAELRLQGAGFHSQHKVIFLLDGRLPLLNQRGQAASIQTDASGRFTVKLWLGQSSGAGPHQIFAREIASGRQITLAITITAVSATSVPGNAGVQHTPVPPLNPTATPIPAVPPTPVPPTLTPQPPVSTSTSGTPLPSSSPSPLVPTSETTATSGDTLTPGQGQVAGSSSLGNSLNSEDDSHSFLARLAHLNLLVWLSGICYFISLFLLGLAGLLRRRRR